MRTNRVDPDEAAQYELPHPNSFYFWSFNPLYIGGLFHCYMLDMSMCHFRSVGSILSLLLFFLKILLANNVDPGQRHVASDPGCTVCL